MNLLLLLGALVLTACLIGSKLSHLLRIPTLFFFIALGMLFGSDGLLKIEFSDYALSEQLCSAALVFIMFYGGFGTKWNTARPVALKSVLLSTFGVLITAGLTGLFCYFFLGFDLMEGMLIGAVLGSTDAASVFSILRSQKLNLKYGTAPMLEIESGSNDPCAYTLTVILLSAMGGSVSVSQIAYVIFSQIVYGIIAGDLVADRVYRISDIVEKPLPSEAPSNVGAMGRYVLTPEIFDVLARTKPGKKGEVQLTDALREYAEMYGYVSRSTRYDIGDIPGWIVSNLQLLLQDERYRDLILSVIQTK